MKRYKRIVSNPKIMFGKPVIKGTRVTVELILRKFSAGLSAAQEFAADLLSGEEFYFAESA